MKKLFLLLLVAAVNLYSQSAPMKKGVNLANWFQASDVKQIQFNRFTRDDFTDIKTLGIDHIRLPINLQFMSKGFPDYILEPLFLELLDSVVTWAEQLDLHLIIDNHTFDVNSSTPVDYDNVLIPLWKQMAQHFKNRSNLIYFEILNEPHGIDDLTWNTIQKKTVEEIRRIDSVHTIIIGGADWNSFNNLDAIPVYDDDNLIYTFHFYEPFLFTHQGASWAGGGIEKVEDIPFPYDINRMPDKPDFNNGEWASGSFDNYYIDGTVEKIKSLIDVAYDFSLSRNVPVYCGELGVYMPNSNEQDRVFWHSVVINYLEEKEIAWSIWDYDGGFGLFEKGSESLFDYDLNDDLLRAMNLNVPKKKSFLIEPDSSSLILYGDFPSQFVDISFSGNLDFYSDQVINDTGFSLKWSGAERYRSLSFDFSPNRDLSYLTGNNFQIDFWIKSTGNVDKLDIRFIDTKKDVPEDHPWRMRYTLTQFDYQNDNTWHHVQIPLKFFEEQGSWDNNTWYNPVNAFAWNEVDLFEFTSEYYDFNGAEFWIDDVKIINPNLVSVKEKMINDKLMLFQNYPNPFNPETVIEYHIPDSELLNGVDKIAEIKIYDILGREVAVIYDSITSAGRQKIIFNASHLSAGTYFYRLVIGNRIISKKMMLLK